MRKKKKYFIGLKISDRELEVVERIKDARGHETISEAIRELIRFADIYFDEKLTVEKGFKAHILELAKNNPEVFAKYPVADLLYSIPVLEKKLNKNSNNKRNK